MSRETTDTICCQKCGEEVAAGFRFCTSCGAPIISVTADLRDKGTEGLSYVHTLLCPECGTTLNGDENFFGMCGSRVWGR